MINDNMVAAVKNIPIPLYLLEAVPEVAPSLAGVDLDIYDKSVCLCPVHQESTPSFRWFENTNTCYCFGCGVGGDIINLHRTIMEANEETKVSFIDAVEYLYNRFVGDASGFNQQLSVEKESRADRLAFELTVLDRAGIKNRELAEDLYLLITLGKLSGDQATEYYHRHMHI